MKKVWFDEAWEDYLYWQTQDKKTLKRVNALDGKPPSFMLSGNEKLAKRAFRCYIAENIDVIADTKIRRYGPCQ